MDVNMMTSSIRIVGESETLTSVEVLARSLFEYNATINNISSCNFMWYIVWDLVK